MGALRQYILCVICMAFLCGVVQLLFSSGSLGGVIKLITGLMLTVTVISPLLREDLIDLDSILGALSVSGDYAAEEGAAAAADMNKALIMEKTKTYILSKALEMGADVEVQIAVSDQSPWPPERVSVSGTVSPYIKKQLSALLERELGIAEENQEWIS